MRTFAGTVAGRKTLLPFAVRCCDGALADVASRMRWISVLSVSMIIVCSASLHAQSASALPHLRKQGTGSMAGFLLDSAAQTAEIPLGGYVFTVKHEHTWPYAVRGEGDTPRAGGMIVMTAEDEFTIAGSGVVATFQSSNPGTVAGIASTEEGTFVEGRWVAGRRMNGDQDHQGRQLHLPGGECGIQKVRLYTFK